MAGQISDFRLFLHKLSDELGSEELENLKFLCADILTKARLEKIKNTKELFVAIGEVTEGEEKQLDLLKQLFQSIYRLDLLSKVEKFQQSRRRKGRCHFCYAQHLETIQTIGGLQRIPLCNDKGEAAMLLSLYVYVHPCWYKLWNKEAD